MSKLINHERVEAFKLIGKIESNYDCLDCAMKSDYKVKGFYAGMSGVSDLNIVKDLGREQHFVDKEELENIQVNID